MIKIEACLDEKRRRDRKRKRFVLTVGEDKYHLDIEEVVNLQYCLELAIERDVELYEKARKRRAALGRLGRKALPRGRGIEALLGPPRKIANKKK